MEDTKEYEENNGGHPFLFKLVAKNLFLFGKQSGKNAEIIDVRQPSKTIICSYEWSPRFFVPLRNPSGCYLRCFLVEELLQIQGFPADFVLAGTWEEQIRQIGNAIPPPVITSIINQIVNPTAVESRVDDDDDDDDNNDNDDDNDVVEDAVSSLTQQFNKVNI
jgi:site-specific DNA-cytosine methylase